MKKKDLLINRPKRCDNLDNAEENLPDRIG